MIVEANCISCGRKIKIDLEYYQTTDEITKKLGEEHFGSASNPIQVLYEWPMSTRIMVEGDGEVGLSAEDPPSIWMRHIQWRKIDEITESNNESGLSLSKET